MDTSHQPQDNNSLVGLNRAVRRKIQVMERQYRRRYLRKLEREAKYAQKKNKQSEF